MTQEYSTTNSALTEKPQSQWSVGLALLFSWVALLFFAHREALGFYGRSGSSNPIESFFFEAGATIPSLHYAAFAYVIWARRKALLKASSGDSAPVAAMICALLGCLLFLWARRVDQLDLLIDSLTLLLAAGSLWVGGWRRLGLFALPLAILWLARPFPPMLIHSLHEWLQTMTGDIAVVLLSPFGPLEMSGHLLNFRGQTFHVVEGCSGLRGTMTLIFATCVYSEVTSRSWVQTISLVLVAMPIGLAVNGLRVVAIMLAPGTDASRDHSIQGLVMICLGVILIAGFDSIGDRWLWPRGSRSWREPAESIVAVRMGRRSRWMEPLVLASLLVAVSLVPIRQKMTESRTWKLDEIRRQMGPWHQARVFDVDHDRMGSVDFRDKLYREYVRGEDHVRLFMGADDRRRRDQSSLSPKTLLPGRGWVTIESTPIKLSPSGRVVERLRQRRFREEALSFHFRLGAADILTESLRWILAADLRSSRSPAELAVVRVTAPIVRGDINQAQKILLEFMVELESDLSRASPADLP